MHESFSVTEYPGGVLAIDSGYLRENMAACYLVEGDDAVAFIETGTNSSVPRLMQTLERRGWQAGQVKYVIVTHVHLDHAGGAGSLMQELPNATFLVHPYGLRHMIDPARLEAGSRAVYGDELFDRLYGTLVPVAQTRTRAMQDGEEVILGSRRLRFMDTPGHARHHFCVHDSLTNGWFTGDTFGLSYREFDTEKGVFMIPTTTPVQFDPEALLQSIQKLMAIEPECMYLTHYGRLDDLTQCAQAIMQGVTTFAGFGERFEGAEDRVALIENAIREWLLTGLHAHGVDMSETQCLELLQGDISLNAAGISHWLDYRKRQ